MRLVAATIFALPLSLLAQNPRLESSDSEPRIVVTATKSARVAPDRVTLYITIEGTGETTAEAAQRGNQKLQAVMTAVRPLAAPDGIATMPYGVGPAPNMNGYPGAVSQASFVARYVLRVQPKGIDQITSVASAAIAAGANGASPPTFEASGADSVRRVRYGEALTQARRDAESLAAALGGTLGSIIEVSSTGNANPAFNQSFVSFINRYDFSGPTPSPDVVVTASVTVRYRFIAR